MLDYIKHYILSKCKFEDLMAFLEFSNKYIAENIKTECNFKNQINGVFKMENVLWRFVKNQISPLTNELEIRTIEEAMETPFDYVNQHIETALQHYSDNEKPDFRNSIKEAISAVEAASKILSKSSKSGLAQLFKELESKGLYIDPALKSAFNSLYGWTSGKSGIRHAKMDMTKIGQEEAKYMLVSCSAFVHYLIEKATDKEII